MPVVETFFGYVETTKDSLLLLEACRQGVLPRVRRRLQEQERPLVKSGAVFCFDENESGIKRWTDGLVWSPSRILGNFLIYRELDDKKSTTDDNDDQDNPSQQQQIITSGLTLLSKRQRERSLVGSLRNSYRFKPNGLIKKSMSVVVNGVHQHLVSYYNKDDVVANKFRTPSDIPELAMLEISSELLDGQNFRIPFYISNDPASIRTTNTALSGDKRITSVKTSTSERPTKQKKRSSSSSSSVHMLSNTSISPQYSNVKNNDSLTSSSPQYNSNSNSINNNDNGSVSSIPTPSSTSNYHLDSMHDGQPISDHSTHHQHHQHHQQQQIQHHQLFASYSQPQHIISPLTESSSNDIFFQSSFVTDPPPPPPPPPHHHQNSITENQSIVHHLPPLPPPPTQKQHSTLSSGSLDIQPYMAMYKDTTTKSAGMLSEPISPLNNDAYYQHHHHHHQQHHQHHRHHRQQHQQLTISSTSSDSDSVSGSGSSNSSTPSTSYGVGSDAHHHQQWTPHSFSTGYSNERYDQNPHQHLFSSTSFHAINHAAIPTRPTELVSNAFMLDTNALLGSGWNDFEMQM